MDLKMKVRLFKDKFVSDSMLKFAVLLSYGVVFPPLGVIVCICILIEVFPTPPTLAL
jgi:hypothetical protein